MRVYKKGGSSRSSETSSSAFAQVDKEHTGDLDMLTSSSTKTKRSLVVTDDDHAPPSFQNGRKPLTILLANACEPAAPLFKSREESKHIFL